jgi:glutamate-5-semialdehyde dehydrogenase
MKIMSNQISDVTGYMKVVGEQARQASRLLASATTAQKNRALEAIADELDGSRDRLITENRKDLEAGA